MLKYAQTQMVVYNGIGVANPKGTNTKSREGRRVGEGGRREN